MNVGRSATSQSACGDSISKPRDAIEFWEYHMPAFWFRWFDANEMSPMKPIGCARVVPLFQYATSSAESPLSRAGSKLDEGLSKSSEPSPSMFASSWAAQSVKSSLSGYCCVFAPSSRLNTLRSSWARPEWAAMSGPNPEVVTSWTSVALSKSAVSRVPSQPCCASALSSDGCLPHIC